MGLPNLSMHGSDTVSTKVELKMEQKIFFFFFFTLLNLRRPHEQFSVSQKLDEKKSNQLWIIYIEEKAWGFWDSAPVNRIGCKRF